MSAIDDDLLQRYYDGELSPVEERSVRSRVDADPAAQQKLKQLARLSEVLRDAADEMGREVDSEALFASITSGISQAESSAPGKFEVIRNEWVDHKKKTWVPLVVGGAVAAAALLTILGPARHAGQTDEGALAEQVEAPAVVTPLPPQAGHESDAAAAPVEIMAAQGSHVEDVDFGDNAGTVFEIETRGISAAVVWIADDEAEEDTP